MKDAKNTSVEETQCLLNALINTAFAVSSYGLYVCEFEKVLQSMVEQGIEPDNAKEIIKGFEYTGERYPFVIVRWVVDREQYCLHREEKGIDC